MADPLNVAIATIPKNRREELRVTLSEFKGAKFADIRVYAEAGLGDERRPSRQGVTCSFERLPELARAVNEAEAQARALGLIGGAA